MLLYYFYFWLLVRIFSLYTLSYNLFVKKQININLLYLIFNYLYLLIIFILDDSLLNIKYSFLLYLDLFTGIYSIYNNFIIYGLLNISQFLIILIYHFYKKMIIDKNDICWICHMNNSDDKFSTSCKKHFFHKKCLEKWLLNGNGCPICRI